MNDLGQPIIAYLPSNEVLNANASIDSLAIKWTFKIYQAVRLERLEAGASFCSRRIGQENTTRLDGGSDVASVFPVVGVRFPNPDLDGGISNEYGDNWYTDLDSYKPSLYAHYKDRSYRRGTDSAASGWDALTVNRLRWAGRPALQIVHRMTPLPKTEATEDQVNSVEAAIARMILAEEEYAR